MESKGGRDRREVFYAVRKHVGLSMKVNAQVGMVAKMKNQVMETILQVVDHYENEYGDLRLHHHYGGWFWW